jgi:hypothetical protein
MASAIVVVVDEFAAALATGATASAHAWKMSAPGEDLSVCTLLLQLSP